MPELSEVREVTKSIPVDLGGIVVQCEYLPFRFTRKYQREMQKKGESIQAKIDAGEVVDDDETEGIAQNVCHVLKSWDLVNKGKPCPITVSFLVDELGWMATAKILQAILGDINPTAKAADPN